MQQVPYLDPMSDFMRVAWVKKPKFSMRRSRIKRSEIQAVPASSHQAPARSFLDYKYKDLKTEKRLIKKLGWRRDQTSLRLDEGSSIRGSGVNSVVS